MKSKDMNRRIITGLAVLFGAGFATQEAKADSLNILISPAGTDYYQWVIGTYTSPWQTQNSVQGSWDSMMTNPGIPTMPVVPMPILATHDLFR